MCFYLQLIIKLIIIWINVKNWTNIHIDHRMKIRDLDELFRNQSVENIINLVVMNAKSCICKMNKRTKNIWESSRQMCMEEYSSELEMKFDQLIMQWGRMY